MKWIEKFLNKHGYFKKVEEIPKPDLPMLPMGFYNKMLQEGLIKVDIRAYVMPKKMNHVLRVPTIKPDEISFEEFYKKDIEAKIDYKCYNIPSFSIPLDKILNGLLDPTYLELQIFEEVIKNYPWRAM